MQQAWRLHQSELDEDGKWEACFELLVNNTRHQKLNDDEAAFLEEYCPPCTSSSPDSLYVLLGRDERNKLMPNQYKSPDIPIPEEIYVSKYFFAKQKLSGYPWQTGPFKNKASAGGGSSKDDVVSDLAKQLQGVNIEGSRNPAPPSRGVKAPLDAQKGQPTTQRAQRGSPGGFRKIPVRYQDGMAWLLPIPSGITNEKTLDPKFWDDWFRKAAKPSLGQYLSLRSTNPDYTLWVRSGYMSDTIAKGALTSAFDFEPKHGVKTRYLVDTAIDRVANRTDYVFLSENPFQHYTTWIHKEDLRNYLQDHPGRPIPTKTEVEAASKVVMMSQAKRVQEAKAQSEVLALDHWLHDPLVDVKLTAEKQAAARGNRDKTLSQGRLMGSASTAAFEHLKWKRDPGAKTNRLRSGMFMAEWLHLAAFSYGGILDDFDDSESQRLNVIATDATPEQEVAIADEIPDLPPKMAQSMRAYHSSQIPLNLMLGTSETNSIMTRYETAWQNLIAKEMKFRKNLDLQELGDSKAVVAGGLTILASDAHDLIQARDPMGPKGSGLSPLTATKLTPEQMELSQEYPWLKFVIDYYVMLEHYSGVLQQFRPSCQTTFYPFMRLFFTRGESLADKKLLDGLAKSAMSSTPQQRAVQMENAKDKWKKTLFYKMPYRYQIGDGYLDDEEVKQREAKLKFPPQSQYDTLERRDFRGLDKKTYI